MAGEFRRRLLKPSPWGEGGWPPGQTDEGTIIERFRFSQGGFAAPAATYFAHGGKVGKTPPGTAPMSTAVLIVAFPRSPFYGGRQLGRLSGLRKGAGGSADWLTFYDRCR